MILIGEIRRIARRNVCPNATLRPNPIWACMGLYPGIRDEIPASNSLINRGFGAKIHPSAQNNGKLVCASLLLIRTIFCTRFKTYVYSVYRIMYRNISGEYKRSGRTVQAAWTAYGLLNALRSLMYAFMRYTISSVEGPATITKSRGECTNPWSLHIN